MEGEVWPLDGGLGGGAMEENGPGEWAPSRGIAESAREYERAGRRDEGMGVVAER